MNGILVWGTGKISSEFLTNMENVSTVEGFIQTEPTALAYKDKRVYSPHEISDSFRYIVIANACSDEIYDVCKKLSIPDEKLIFMVRGLKTPFNEKKDIEELIGVKNYTNYLAQYNKVEESFFKDDLAKYNAMNGRSSFVAKEAELWPVIGDKYGVNTGEGNYFWQDLWAATKIISAGVNQHYDIGSRVDGFIAHLLSAGIKVNMIDIRKIPVEYPLLETVIGDATTLSNIVDESIDSMSALCSLEHFGLGRYGDEIDPEACFTCFGNIQKKLKKGGNLYISVPIGRERVEFNAHRVFYARTIIDCFSGLSLSEYSCAAEGRIEYNVPVNKYDNDNHNGEFRYGLFHFVKE